MAFSFGWTEKIMLETADGGLKVVVRLNQKQVDRAGDEKPNANHCVDIEKGDVHLRQILSRNNCVFIDQ